MSDRSSLTLVNRIIESLLAYKPEKIILFGSAARGDADAYSDIDLIVIKDTDQRFVQRLVEVARCLPREVNADILVYTPAEIKAMIEGDNPFITRALAEGVVLYENP